ncbi:MAG: ribosome-recycling factor, partial [Ruthenibacterium sp.]
LVKDALKLGEETKIVVRNVRRDAIEKFKAQKKTGDLTEDDLKNLEDEMQKLTDKYIKQVDSICEGKTKDIMEL